MRTGIVWFTNDLRLADNAVLDLALQTCDRIIPLYICSPEWQQTNAYGFLNQGHFRTQFVFESLLDLDQSLRAKQSGLLLKFGAVESILKQVVQQFKVDVIYTQKAVAVNELKLHNALKSDLQNMGCELISINNHSLYHESDLPFALSQMPLVFTDFRRQIEAIPLKALSSIGVDSIPSPTIEPMQWPNLDAFETYSSYGYDRRNTELEGGQFAGFKRLNAFVFGTQAIQHYKDNRNALNGDFNFSKLSPWLALGCISAKQIYHAVKQFEQQYLANESTYWLVFELLWRDFFIFSMMKQPNAYFLVSGLHQHKPHQPIIDEQLLQHWCNAQTSNDLVNALMTELNCTGFMSNRGRQIVASYFCHDMGLDWRYGAAYFQQQLIDFDVSSNWCNWAYIAGVGNNPRGKSHFNIQKQADQFDADYAFRQLWLKHSI